jgi:isopenicillin N synthase-like dioxygenase
VTARLLGEELPVSDIPVIDLAPSREGAEGERAVARAIDRACREIGFFVIVGHGIERSVFTDVNAALARFFGLPLVEKQRFRLATGATQAADEYTPYGYSGLLEENAFAYMGLAGKPSDYVEKYSVGKMILDDASALPLPVDQLGNELRRDLKAYYQACERLAAEVMVLFAVALGRPRDFFTRRIDRSNDSLRAHAYPGYSDALENDQGMGAHKDSTLISLLSHTAPGIEVRRKDGAWIMPPFRDVDQFLVNIGDLMAHWTDHAYVSTEHQVVLTRHPRQSIVFFKLTNEDEIVEVGNRQMDALFGRHERVGQSPTDS